MNRPNDRDLGMSRPITRRDFLNGVSIAITGSILGSSWVNAGSPHDISPVESGDYYPPELTGMRGSHEGSFEVAHQLRDGLKITPSPVMDTGETVDLAVVGGGISGLSAAYFFRKAAGPRAKILVLDNHDDFGGHAKRNEFRHGDRLLIGYGGTQTLEDPGSYPPEATALLKELGVETDRFYTAFDQDLYKSLNLRRGVFFDKETFGTDRLVVGAGSLPWKEFLASAPLSDQARKSIARAYEDRVDYLPHLSPEEKLAYLRGMTYRDYLTQVAKVHEDALSYFQTLRLGLWAIGADVLPAWIAMRDQYPGFQGLGLQSAERGEPYIHHFPDGNASIARLLVRSMIPAVAPGNSMEDIVTSRFDYGRLDEKSSPIRIRLNSTVVHVRHLGDKPATGEIGVTYVRKGKTERIRARQCIFAGYHAMVPHICPELPKPQATALSYSLRAPLVYTNVLIRNWTSFHKLGLQNAFCPGSYNTSVSLDFPVSLGDYRCPRSPKEPMVLHLTRVPCSPGLPAPDQFRAGRRDLLRTSFKLFERNIRDQLGRMLSGGGFDPSRDIEAITVNRWPHGYAYGYDPVKREVAYDFDDWPDEKRTWLAARKRFGQISFAGTGAASNAMTESAIQEAHRAVKELSG
ncbi:MAG: NAD(P)-binding protein [Acidobacteriota bacterium]